MRGVAARPFVNLECGVLPGAGVGVAKCVVELHRHRAWPAWRLRVDQREHLFHRGRVGSAHARARGQQGGRGRGRDHRGPQGSEGLGRHSRCICTHPEVATVCLTEEATKEKGIEIKTAKVPLSALGRAMAINATEGFFTVVADMKRSEVLGVYIVGPSCHRSHRRTLTGA